MCSVGDDVEDQENLKLMPSKLTFTLGNAKCLKCRIKEPNVVLHNKYPYCKTCFLTATVHKFKALLGKHRPVKPNEIVLVSHKAGHPSTSLLHLLRSGLDLTTPKRIRFKPIVVYVENNFDLPLSERTNILKKISDEAQSFKFQIYFVSLAQYSLKPTNLCNLLKENFEDVELYENDAASIKGCMNKKANSTTQQEVYKILERDLLTGVAKLLNASCVFTPELSIDVASRLLTTVALGRGAHATYEIGTVDVREEVSIMRPLRSFTMKELALYNFYNKLEPVSHINKKHYNTSVQSLMNKFVLDLQTNYPATISTIVKTGDKLCVNKDLLTNEKCVLCKAPVENPDMQLNSTEATNFSHNVSLKSLSLKEHDGVNGSNGDKLRYCYACQKISSYLL